MLPPSLPPCFPPGGRFLLTLAPGAQHGTLPWTVEGKTRTTLFYKYNARGSAWSADFFEPDDYVQYVDMDPFKLAMLEPPNSRYGGRTLSDSLVAAPAAMVNRGEESWKPPNAAKL